MKKGGQRLNEVEAQAVAWLTRRDRGLNAEEELEFRRWRFADVRHETAVMEIDAFWTALDRPAESGRIDALRSELWALSRRDRRRRAVWGTTMTVLATAACLAVMFWPRLPVTVPAATAPVTARVSWPERRILPDESAVELKDGAEISIAFDEHVRRVILQKGEAHFQVTKNAHKPFVVEAGAVQVRAVGTAFAVQLGRAAVEVVVTEGVVRVTPPSAVSPSANTPSGVQESGSVDGWAFVTRGERTVVPLAATVSAPVVVTVPAAELGQRLSWRLPRLDFSDTTLAEACALFNQHNQMQLRVADNAVAATRITGVFRADNVQGFVGALESTLGIHADRRSGVIVLRRAGE